MSSKIVDFVRSLQLPSVEEESLIKELESNPIVAGSISAEGIDKSSLTTSISMVARKVLASRGVVTEPLDKVELDTNWYVTLKLDRWTSAADDSNEGLEPAPEPLQAFYFPLRQVMYHEYSKLSLFLNKSSPCEAAVTLQTLAGLVLMM